MISRAIVVVEIKVVDPNQAIVLDPLFEKAPLILENGADSNLVLIGT